MGRGPRGFPVYRGPDGVAAALGPSVVAFGKFDGVHLGHRALLDRAAAAGYRLGLPHGAATFERHPYAHLRRDRVPPMLTGLGERLRLLCEAGARFVVLFPADASVLGIPAEDFARDVLRDRMGVRLVVVGKNFHFGRGGAGDVGTLRRLTSVTGLDGVEIDMADTGGEVISSSRIREHLAHGDVARANALLGRPHEVVGRTEETGGSSALVLVSPTRAVPATGTYRTSVSSARLSTPRCRALTTVHPPDGGLHRLEVEWQGGAAPVVAAGRGVRIAFEGGA
jgi:riboflavin kinase / FMN adenylyltransferase